MCSGLTTLLQFFKGALLLHQLCLCALKLLECGLQLRFRHGAYVGIGRQPGSPPLASPNPPAPSLSPSAFKFPPNPCFLQQFLQAPTSSFRELSITFCSEAGMTPPHIHTLGQGTPFSKPVNPIAGASASHYPVPPPWQFLLPPQGCAVTLLCSSSRTVCPQQVLVAEQHPELAGGCREMQLGTVKLPPAQSV